MKKGILFDLDGTLWDSREAVAASWNEELELLGVDYRVTKERQIDALQIVAVCQCTA